MKPVLRIGKSLPELAVGQWQLHWLGQVESVPQAVVTPFVFAYFHRVERLESGELRHHRQTKRVRMPITDTPVFPIGTIVSEGCIQEVEALDSAFKWDEVTIDFTRDNIEVFSRLVDQTDDAELLIESQFQLRLGKKTAAEDRQYNSLLLKVGGPEDVPHIFPCWTIFQFFWAPSSKWAQIMVDGRFLDPQHYLVNMDRSWMSRDDRQAMLWLRQWMKDDDVPYLAAIIFDDYAMERGADIYRALANGNRSRGPRFIRALPPFQGAMSMKVLRRKVDLVGSKVWLVQSIESCGYKLNLEEIKYDRDNDGRSLDDVLEGTDSDLLPMEREQLFPAVSESVLELSHLPHRSSSNEADVDIGWMGARFPNLETIHTEKMPQIDTDYESLNRAQGRLAMWEREVSSLGDSDSAADRAPRAVLRAQKHLDSLRDDSQRPTLGNVALVAGALLGASGDSLEIDGASHIVVVEPLFPGAQVGDFFLVPLEPAESRQPAWRFVDEEKSQRKRGLCLRISFQKVSDGTTTVRYLLDFEPRLRDQKSILLFWRHDGQPLNEEWEALSAIVARVVRRESTVLPLEYSGELCSRNRRHTSSDASSLLREIYLARDRLEDGGE